MLYRGMDRAALDAAYNNTAAVGQAKRDAYVGGWTERGEAVRAERPGKFDLAYGPGARERLDFFPCGTAGAPTLAFIHGGYWQQNNKEPYAFLGEGVLEAGYNLALIEYTLGPAARMGQICDEIRRATAWLIDHLAELGGDPARLYVSGHSAGGHLTAIAMGDPRVAGGVAISGIFDLEPIRLCYLNDNLDLSEAEVARDSPIHHLPAVAGELIIAVGLGELPELIRQSTEYAAAWKAKGLPGRLVRLEAHNHFSILEELADSHGELLAALAGVHRRKK